MTGPSPSVKIADAATRAPCRQGDRVSAPDLPRSCRVIDRRGTWWTGSEASDVEEYLLGYTQDGYPADRYEQPRCTCSNAVFHLEADRDEGCARRTCVECGLDHFICDSGEFAEDAALQEMTCVCGQRAFDLGVAFSPRADGNVRWISVGVRCVACGVLGCPVEWEVDYAPTPPLYEQV